MKTITRDQLSNMNLIYSKYSFEYFLESTQKLGFKQFEFYCNIPHFSSVYSSTRDIDTYARMIEKSGLQVSCVTPEQAFSCYNQCAKEEKSRKAGIDYYKAGMYAAAALHSPYFLTGIGAGFYDEPIEDSWNRGFELAEELLKIAEEYHVKIGWEIGCTYVTPLLNGLESSKKVMKRLDSPYSGLTVDTCPVCFEHLTLQDYFDAFGEKVFHIHLNDGIPDGFLTWGDGKQPLEQHLADLSRNDFSGSMTLELGDASYLKKPHESVKRGLDTLYKYLPYTAK